jgi:hypothetical protein
LGVQEGLPGMIDHHGGGCFVNLVLGFLIYAMMLWHWGDEYIPTNKFTHDIF